MALSDNQNVVFDVFVHHIPRFFGTFFGATDTQTFTLTESVIHQPLVLTNFIAIDGNDFARLRREITAQNSRNLRSPMKQMPVESFSSR